MTIIMVYLLEKMAFACLCLLFVHRNTSENRPRDFVTLSFDFH